MRNIEVGIKTEPVRGLTANLTAYDTEIQDFQTQVTNASVGVLRGYLANAEKVRVRGAEFDVNAAAPSRPVALHRRRLHRRQVRVVPRCAAAARGHRRSGSQGHLRLGPAGHLEVGGVLRRRVRARARPLFGQAGQFFGALDTSYRSDFSSSASYSRYLVVDGYALVNARVGFRASDGWTVFLWSRNLLDRNYFELLTRGAGQYRALRRPTG